MTDLDGTLLDDRYDEQHAARALDRLRQQWPQVVGVALASSKTLAEMVSLARHCTTPPALIFENGCGWSWGENAPILCDGVVAYNDIRRHITTLRTRWGYDFAGFGDFGPEGVIKHTGLESAAAERACERTATEPLLWRDTPARLQAFTTQLASAGLRVLSGGRFLHVCSGFDKATAAAEWQLALQRQLAIAHPPRLIACGDAPNDAAMLNAADHAIVFPNRGTAGLPPLGVPASRAATCGPDAWLTAVTQTLQLLQERPT
ncbi:MAG: HAD-IIB family hydrolase [Pseudomonadota bacterium]